VRERIEMRVGNTMERDSNPVGSKSKHRVLVWIGIVDRFFGVDVCGERDREPLLDECERLPPLGRRNQVQGPDLIIFAPASPVRELGLPPLELRSGDGVRGSGGL